MFYKHEWTEAQITEHVGTSGIAQPATPPAAMLTLEEFPESVPSSSRSKAKQSTKPSGIKKEIIGKNTKPTERDKKVERIETGNDGNFLGIVAETAATGKGITESVNVALKSNE